MTAEEKRRSPRGNDREGEFLSLRDFCLQLGISQATGRNWVRLHKLEPVSAPGEPIRFAPGYADVIARELAAGARNALRGRRNKRFAAGETIRAAGAEMTDELRRCLLGECALQLLLQAEGAAGKPGALRAFLEEGTMPEAGRGILEPLLPEPQVVQEQLAGHPGLFDLPYTWEPGRDTLGELYQSLQRAGTKKRRGAYYTPPVLAERLCEQVFSEGDFIGRRILDPCCGSGSFLLQLPDFLSPEQIYGNDADPVSLQLTIINMALRFGPRPREFWREHFTVQNYLDHRLPVPFDCILGNPPWGTDIVSELPEENSLSAPGEREDSCDQFLEQALHDLVPGGTLAFVLPEALLSVKSHRALREQMAGSCRFRYLEYLGEAFPGVQCPSVLLMLEKSEQPEVGVGLVVREKNRYFTIRRPRPLREEGFSFHMSDEEFAICRKMQGGTRRYLRGNAEFALGIVTGDNGRFLSEEPGEKLEPVLRGTDIFRYHIQPARSFLEYRPERFQQTAPEPIYRAEEKLLYRFICDQPVFALDGSGSLSLNSCNVLIPHLEGMNIRTVLAVLNSRPARFFFRRWFRSLKVLRSHLERFPLPQVTGQEQEEIIALVNALMEEKGDREEIYNLLDERIAALYGLEEAEYLWIRQEETPERLLLSPGSGIG